MDANVIAELTPTGTLRAAINMANMLLVTSEAPNGDPAGVAPDMAADIAGRLGVGVTYVPYASPGEVGDAVGRDEWDIALIAAEPSRAEHILFTTAYVEIEATYLVPPGSPLQTVEDVDAPGIRIATMARSAYDLYLTRTLQHAELVRNTEMGGTFDMFVAEKLDALSGLRPALIKNALEMPGSRVLDGRYTAVQQAIGCKKQNTAAGAFLQSVVDDVRQSGLVGRLIEKHGVVGRLQAVAPGAD